MEYVKAIVRLSYVCVILFHGVRTYVVVRYEYDYVSYVHFRMNCARMDFLCHTIHVRTSMYVRIGNTVSYVCAYQYVRMYVLLYDTNTYGVYELCRFQRNRIGLHERVRTSASSNSNL